MGHKAYIDYFIRGLIVFDLFAMTLAFLVAALANLSGFSLEAIGGFLSVRMSIANILLFIVLLIVWGTLSLSCSWHTVRTLERPLGAFSNILTFTSLGVIFIGITCLFLPVDFVTPSFLLFFWVLAVTLTALGRLLVSAAYRRGLGKMENRPSLLLVGINSRSIKFANDINFATPASHRVVGFVDDRDYCTDEFETTGYKRVTDIENLQDYLRHFPIDEVLISLPMKSRYDDASRLVSICEEQGIKLHILADLFQYRMTHSRAEKFGRSSVITVSSHAMMGMPAFLKRLLDIFASAAALLVLSPLMVLISVAIKVAGPGDVFFLQERIGLNKKSFRMIKFRTMVVDAEERQVAIESMNEASGPAFKIRNDPRITTIGKALRRTSLDELPQLLNVLRGEMSLVGPRPLPLRDYAGFSEDWHRRRVSVRPGMTGLWQVESRDHSSFDNWMKLDMQYIDRWSLWLDIKIILKTIPAMVRGSGD